MNMKRRDMIIAQIVRNMDLSYSIGRSITAVRIRKSWSNINRGRRSFYYDRSIVIGIRIGIGIDRSSYIRGIRIDRRGNNHRHGGHNILWISEIKAQSKRGLVSATMLCACFRDKNRHKE